MKIIELLKNSDRDFKRNLRFFFCSYFLVLFNYPLIRASTTSLFFESYGAKSSPAAWAWAVLFLSFSIFISNRLQKRLPVQKVFALVSIISGLIFLSGNFSVLGETKIFAYLAFIWKEIYIVLQVHLLLGYANNYFQKDTFRILVGPVGAVGSLGGIFGGLLTSYLSSRGGTSLVLLGGIGFVILPFVFFLLTEKIFSQAEKPKTPLASLDTPDVRRYVFYLCAIVALTQFIINIADFNFNIAFEKSVPTADLRTSYLGDIYTWTNALTFVFQFVFLPFILPRVKEKHLHLFIPISYLICLSLMMGGSHLGLLPVSILYIYFKAADYSFFSAGKEILYQPLQNAQKYGAKYLTDMLVYRSSKALIALILIYLQSSTILNMMMVGFLLLWIAVVVRLFRIHQNLFLKD